MKNTNRLNEIKNKIVSSIAPNKIVLFGSRATGKYTKDSDYDLIVIWDNELNQRESNFKIRRLFPGRDFSLDVFVYKTKDEKIYKNIRGSLLYTAFKNGKIIYEQK
ncbi:MAG: hypothetical protein A2252_04145 [Elusimicrobia bacterium RIFOXYA2_FULL_39_19]|nr:MAG: hypothetical protein A2252_04145 [Elusimicrobia bacterium RIFOXYA2_FULL_39_19]